MVKVDKLTVLVQSNKVPFKHESGSVGGTGLYTDTLIDNSSVLLNKKYTVSAKLFNSLCFNNLVIEPGSTLPRRSVKNATTGHCSATATYTLATEPELLLMVNSKSLPNALASANGNMYQVVSPALIFKVSFQVNSMAFKHASASGITGTWISVWIYT